MQNRFIATIAILIILSLFVSPALATNGNGETTKDSIPGTDNAGISIITDSATGNQYAAGEVIVRYNYEKIKSTTLMNEYSTRINAKIGAVVIQDLSSKNLPGMQLVQIPNSMSVTDAIAEYEKSPDVLYAEPNFIYYLSSITPNDPYFSSLQWGLQNTGQTIEGSVGTVGADIDAPKAWDLTTGSNTVVVAVVDSGADYLHPDLSANMWINSNEIPDNGIDDDSNGFIDDVRGWNFFSHNNNPMDGNTFQGTYHGTHCSGIIGAVGNNGIGISGVNWNVKIMPLRVTSAAGSLSTSDGILAINYASKNGANVISNSWGGTGYSQALKDVIDNSPAVVVCAAGNDGRNNENKHSYPSDYTSENLISVAATDNQDQLASFSNYGIISVDLGAPGVDIYSTKKNSSYQYMSGTSMATPFVSGVAALVKAKDPSLTNLQVRSAILNNVDAKSSLSGKVVTGGRMNAYKAVNSIGGGPTVTGISPVTGSTAGGTTVTITGTNFLGATAVKFGTTQAVFTPPVSATSITATSPAGTAGIVDVTVTTPSGTSATSAADKFTYTATPVTPSTIGVFRSGVFYLRNTNTPGDADNVFYYSTAGDTPIAGDWTGRGYDTVGVFRQGQFYLASSNSEGGGEVTAFNFGAASGDWPIAGHWTTAHTGDTVGLFKSGVFYLRNTNTPGDPNNIFAFGAAGDTPIAGDWTGKGYDTVGVFRQGRFYLASSNTDGGGDVNAFSFGSANDIPVIWKHDGKDTVGIFRSGTFYLKNENSAGDADNVFSYGTAGDTPIDGKWI